MPLYPAIPYTTGGGGTGVSAASDGALLTALGAQVSPLYGAPSGATAETFNRHLVTAANTAPATSGTIYLGLIVIAQGVTINNITMVTGTGTLKTGGTHGWYVLTDSNLVVRAATGDQTDAATKWGSASTAYTLATNAYVTTYTGRYYVGIMVANSAGTQPNMAAGTSPAGGITALAPVLSGPSTGGTGTGQTTPPATDGSVTLGAISVAAGQTHFYAYTS